MFDDDRIDLQLNPAIDYYIISYNLYRISYKIIELTQTNEPTNKPTNIIDVSNETSNVEEENSQRI